MSDENQAAAPALSLHQIADAVRLLADEAMRKVELVNAGYHVLIIPDSGPAEYRACIDGQEAAEFLRLNHGRDASVAVFRGRSCVVEQSPPRLVSDEGVFPLFCDPMPDLKAAKKGAVYRLGQPAPPPPPSRAPEVDDVDPMPIRGRDDGDDDGDPEDDELDPD